MLYNGKLRNLFYKPLAEAFLNSRDDQSFKVQNVLVSVIIILVSLLTVFTVEIIFDMLCT